MDIGHLTVSTLRWNSQTVVAGDRESRMANEKSKVIFRKLVPWEESGIS